MPPITLHLQSHCNVFAEMMAIHISCACIGPVFCMCKFVRIICTYVHTYTSDSVHTYLSILCKQYILHTVHIHCMSSIYCTYICTYLSSIYSTCTYPPSTVHTRLYVSSINCMHVFRSRLNFPKPASSILGTHWR